MRNFIKGPAVWAVRLLLCVFRLFPLCPRRIFFSAYEGRQVTCNPRAIYEELCRRYEGQFEAVWCVNQPERQAAFRADGVRTVRYQSLAYFRYLFTSRVVVFNDLQGCSYLPFRKNQEVVQTWHGCGLYKKVGHDIPEKPTGYDARLDWMTRRITLFLSGAQRFSDTVIRGAFGYQGEVLDCGLPRNDILLNEEARQQAADKVRQALQLPPDRKLLLYAPTFRENGQANARWTQNKTIADALERCLGGTYTLLIRTHHMDGMTDTAGIGGSVNVTDYLDMQELLAAADALVSDYSSCIWDFSLTRRPCFLFADDLANYQTQRDFYLDIHRWPFPLATDETEFLQRLQTFDEVAYRAAVEAHLKELGSFETGQASRMAADRIMKSLSV